MSIKNLEERIEYLRNRSIKISSEIENAKELSKVDNRNKENIIINEKINEYLIDNLIIEKYIRSEYFKKPDSIIISMKYNLNQLVEEKNRLNNINSELQNDYNKLKKSEIKIQKKIISFNNNSENN